MTCTKICNQLTFLPRAPQPQRPYVAPAAAQLSNAAPLQRHRGFSTVHLSPAARPFQLGALSPTRCLAAMAGSHRPVACPLQLRARNPRNLFSSPAAKHSPATHLFQFGARSPSKPLASTGCLTQPHPIPQQLAATPMPVPPNVIASEPPQMAHNIREQILAGADVDLSSLLSLLSTSDSNRQIDCGDFSVMLKNPNPLSSQLLFCFQPANLRRAPNPAAARAYAATATAQPSAAVLRSATPGPTAQVCTWLPPPPISPLLPAPFNSELSAQASAWQPAMAGSHSPVARSFQLGARNPRWCFASPAAKHSPAATLFQFGARCSSRLLAALTASHSPAPSPLQIAPPSKTPILSLTTTQVPIPPNAIGSEPPQVAHNIRAQTLAVVDVDLSSLLSLLPTSISNRQIDWRDFSVMLKNLNPLSSQLLSFSEFSIAFSRFTEIICLDFLHRRRKLNDYLAIIT